MTVESRSVWAGRMLSVLRIVAAALYIEHGTQKLFGFPSAGPGTTPVHLISQSGLAGVLEVFGGLAILLGLFTRPVAFVLAGEMAVAYFQVHFPRSFFPIVNRGESPVFFCFFFLYLVFAGGGVWSLDYLIQSTRVRGAERESARLTAAPALLPATRAESLPPGRSTGTA